VSLLHLNEIQNKASVLSLIWREQSSPDKQVGLAKKRSGSSS